MVVVIDYRAGNLYNVGNVLKYLGADFQFSGDPRVVRRAERVILPGQGAAGPAMASLQEQGLDEILRNLTVPFLGICLGLQLLFERSEEDQTPCLGILSETIRRFDPDSVKVPQIGWNQVQWNSTGSRALPALSKGIENGSFFYFVHSYYAPLGEDFTVGRSEYGVCFSSVVRKRNFWGVQFHPERSGEVGLKLLENFLSCA